MIATMLTNTKRNILLALKPSLNLPFDFEMVKKVFVSDIWPVRKYCLISDLYRMYELYWVVLPTRN